MLYWADQTGPQTRTDTQWTMKHALIMGLWQVLALIPGTSRSGITITAARQLGYDRHSGAKLAMLMSIPTILASGVLLTADVVGGGGGRHGGGGALLRAGAIAAVFAFLAALLAALAVMMRLLRSVSFTPYVVYRCVLGVVLLWIAYS